MLLCIILFFDCASSKMYKWGAILPSFLFLTAWFFHEALCDVVLLEGDTHRQSHRLAFATKSGFIASFCVCVFTSGSRRGRGDWSTFLRLYTVRTTTHVQHVPPPHPPDPWTCYLCSWIVQLCSVRLNNVHEDGTRAQKGRGSTVLLEVKRCILYVDAVQCWTPPPHLPVSAGVAASRGSDMFRLNVTVKRRAPPLPSQYERDEGTQQDTDETSLLIERQMD